MAILFNESGHWPILPLKVKHAKTQHPWQQPHSRWTGIRGFHHSTCHRGFPFVKGRLYANDSLPISIYTGGPDTSPTASLQSHRLGALDDLPAGIGVPVSVQGTYRCARRGVGGIRSSVVADWPHRTASREHVVDHRIAVEPDTSCRSLRSEHSPWRGRSKCGRLFAKLP